MNSAEGFILAGGQSRRMGTDKSRLVLAGQTFVERIAGELSAVTSSVTIVGANSGNSTTGEQQTPNSELKTQDSKLKTVSDVHPNWGALGGVHTALAVCRAEWALVVACDFPFVTSKLFLRLLSFRADFAAVAPIQRDGIPQPLCALYRKRPCLDRATELIKTGERKPVALLQSVLTRWLAFAEFANLEGADRFFANINTPEDYVRAREEGVDPEDEAMSQAVKSSSLDANQSSR
jgi:molybdopterin-guanine dinucleotide biosynthesis protein A